MNLQHIKLENLKTAAINVRKAGAKDIADLEPSIRALGVLQPLLVRPNCEGYEIVAGQRRFHALTKIAEDTDIAPVPCIVMAEGDDAKAIEASLAENVARLPMDEIDQFKAFAALTREGRSVEDIASQFGVTERMVRQRLALANLLPPILTAYRKAEISADSLRIMTMATKKQQKAWLTLHKGDDYAPQGHALKRWLFGGAHIPVSNALFDVENYKGNIVSDLFGDERYFDNPDTFWEAQNTAITAAKTRYMEDGWTDVIVLERGEYFPSYDYVCTGKEEGGKVYITVAHDGEVMCYEGQLSRKDIKARKRAEAGESAKAERPELTKAMQNYLDLHRHAAVRIALLTDQGVALRLAVTQIIAGSDLWSVEADPQRANTEAIAESLAANSAEAAFAQEREAIMALLGIESGRSVVPEKGDWATIRNVHDIFATLTKLEDADVMRILTFATAESLPCGSVMVEGLGAKLDVDLKDSWNPDQTFFDLLRDKEAINSMLAEVGGKTVAAAHVTSTAKVQKGIIQDYVNGERTNGKKDWSPRYARFPMKAYTKRDGISVIDRAKDVKAQYA